MLGVTWICAHVCQLTAVASVSPPTFWRGLMFRFVLLAAVLMIVSWVGMAAYALGSQRMVSTGMVILMGGAVALGTLVIGVLLPLVCTVSTRGVSSEPIPG